MALILNIETSTNQCSVCLSRDGEPWILECHQLENGHAEKLTLLIDKVLAIANIQFDLLDAIAISDGPGSYTGLRIGTSTAKGICYSLDIPLIAVSTLKHMAHSDSNIDACAYISLLDARRMDAYVAIYLPDSQQYLTELKSPFFTTLTADSFHDLFSDSIQHLVIRGNAVEKLPNIFFDNPKISCVQTLPNAFDMVPFSQRAYDNKQFVDVAYHEPFYLKKPNITKSKPIF